MKTVGDKVVRHSLVYLAIRAEMIGGNVFKCSTVLQNLIQKSVCIAEIATKGTHGVTFYVQ